MNDYKPRTSSELNQFNIERILKKIHRGDIRVQDANLNRRFDRLKNDNEGMHDDLYAKYVQIIREKSILTI